MLQKASLSNFEFFYNLYMHPEVNPFLLYEIMPPEDFKPIFEKLIHEGVLYVFIDNQIAVGMCKLIPLTYRCSHITYLGGVGIVPKYFGKGLGKKMLLEIIAFCKSNGMSRIELSVATHNHKAFQLYENVGFQKEGMLKNYGFLKSDNRFIDEYLMAILL
ncbi:GNAT family protein [Flavobacterium branchiophilum]|uniref:Probable acetyltransferase, GNAT family n=1 Tax=Flavobacterium branchiophilum (strain FL-15) TaxID=1034807 RepID=G2Z771_FLABF|nr:GNAT family protein [Flavobacterium branchiophilum]CCB69151.1 Probable acetyltransferase, GNAT family [Flavobacterium branchiophilum FL-15]